MGVLLIILLVFCSPFILAAGAVATGFLFTIVVGAGSVLLAFVLTVLTCICDGLNRLLRRDKNGRCKRV